MTNLFEDDNGQEYVEDISDTGPLFLDEEVFKAIDRLRNNATGQDRIHGGLLKLLSENNLKKLTKMFKFIILKGNYYT